MENTAQNSIPWIDDELTKPVTTLPEIIAEEAATGNLIIIIVSAIISITLLFVIAVFIDCRHQKTKKDRLGSRLFKISIPKFRSQGTEREGIADKMQVQEPTTAPATVIV